MTTEENRYGYDELRWLAQNTQKRRRRAIWWTGGLVLGAMTLATAYVQRDRDPASERRSDMPTLSIDLGDVPESLKSINENLAGILQTLQAQQPVSLSFSAGGAQGVSQTVAAADTSIYVNKVIWLVEGSRRFPMAQGDILWIPEADRWLKLDTIGTEPDTTGARTVVEVWRPNAPPSSSATRYTLPKSLPATRNTASCVRISSLGRTQRAGFGPDYVDIDVYFYPETNQGGCPDQPTPPR